MKKTLKFIIAIIITLGILMYSVPAFAASAIISTSASSVKVGDTVTVKITVKGTNIAAAQGTFSYDSSVLTYSSGSGGASNGTIAMVTDTEGGASSLSCTVKFTAKAAGKSNITVSISKTLNYDESSLGTCSAGASITVTSGSTATATAKPTFTAKPQSTQKNTSTAKPTATATAEPTPTPSPTPAVSERELPVDINGKTLYIWQSLDTITVPEGFSDITVTYKGQEITAAANIDNGNFPTLLYVTDGEGNNGTYYLYDEASGALTPYKTISSKAQSFTLIPAVLMEEAPDGYTETEITIDDITLTAWQMDDNKEFYLLCLYDSEGNAGFYTYDSINGTIQRFTALPSVEVEAEPTPSPEPTPEPTPTEEPTAQVSSSNVIARISGDKDIMIIIGGLLLITAGLAVALIIVAAKKKKRSDNNHDTIQTAIADVNKAAVNSDYTPKHSK